MRPVTEFRPHAADRAFRYGDGVFATLSIDAGLLLDAEAHVERLIRSADAIGLDVPESVRTSGRLGEILGRLLSEGTKDAVVRVQVSARPRGRGYGRGRELAWELVEVHARPPPRRPTVAVLAPEEAPVPSLPSVKSCSALAHVLCAMAASRRGAHEAVRTTDGHVLEAAASNVFWETDGALHTPSTALPIYPGVTRSVVIEVARRSGWTVHEGEFAPAALEGAGRAFLTNGVRGVEPVACLNGRDLEWTPALEDLRKAVQAARRQAGMPVSR